MKNFKTLLISSAVICLALTGCSKGGSSEIGDESNFQITLFKSSIAEGPALQVGQLKYSVDFIHGQGERFNEDNEFLDAMDNNYYYFVTEEFPNTVTAVSRTTGEREDILHYGLKYGSVLNHTVCGYYMADPPTDFADGVCYNHLYFGAVGKEQQCFDFESQNFQNKYSQLSDSELIIFSEPNAVNANIHETVLYKYNTDEGAGELIYKAQLDKKTWNNNPQMACYNGEIYLAMCKNSGDNSIVTITTLNSDGKAFYEQQITLPAEYADRPLCGLTVTENHIILQYYNKHVYVQGDRPTIAVIDKNTHEVFTVGADYSIGERYHDSVIDGRYVMFRAGSYSSPTLDMICVFDDETGKLHFINFPDITDKIQTIYTDMKGDAVLRVCKDPLNSESDYWVRFDDVLSAVNSLK